VIRDDLSYRLPMAARKDEIGLLGHALNFMAEHLQTRRPANTREGRRA